MPACRLSSCAALVLALTGALGQAQPSATPAAAAFTAPAPGFELRAVRFVGHRELTDVELQALAAPFLGRPLRALDLEELRQRVSRAYVARGFVNSGAWLDGDALGADGTLTLRIVEGRLARVRASGLGRLTSDYVAARLRRDDEALDVNRLQERFQLLLADPLFGRIAARLMPDAERGQALLDLDVTRAVPWQASLFAHNHVAPAVGGALAGAEGTLRNLLGWGDALALVLAKGEGHASYDLGWTLPLGGERTTLALRLARGRSSVIEEPVAALDVDSVISTREAALAHPVIDEARMRWTLGVAHQLRRNRTTYLGGEAFPIVAGEPSGQTRTEAWRLQQELTLRHERQALALRATLVDGRNNLPAEAALPQQPPSRYRLWQLQGEAAVDSSLGQWRVRAQLQRSADSLVPLERLAIGGRYTVRGYRENQLVRDNGFAAALEWHAPLWRDETLAATVLAIPFVDGGAAWNRGEARGRLISAGLGLKAVLGGLEAELFYARRLERRIPEAHGDLQDHGIHLGLRWRPAL